MKPLPRKLRDLRIENGCISQMALSEATGISQSSLARWELGKTEPRASEIILLCNFYRISADELLDISPLPQEELAKHKKLPLDSPSPTNKFFK